MSEELPKDHPFSNVYKFKKVESKEPADGLNAMREGAELFTINRNRKLNIFFPGLTEGETLVVTTTIDDCCNVIRSHNHKVAIWEALCNLDMIRQQYSPNTAGIGGKYGDPKIDLQIGFVDPD